MVQELIRKINQSNENNIEITLFDAVAKEIALLVEAGAVTRFTRTEAYKNFIRGDFVVKVMTDA